MSAILDLSHLVTSAFVCHKVSAHHQFANSTYFTTSALVLKFSAFFTIVRTVVTSLYQQKTSIQKRNFLCVIKNHSVRFCWFFWAITNITIQNVIQTGSRPVWSRARSRAIGARSWAVWSWAGSWTVWARSRAVWSWAGSWAVWAWSRAVWSWARSRAVWSWAGSRAVWSRAWSRAVWSWSWIHAEWEITISKIAAIAVTPVSWRSGASFERIISGATIGISDWFWDLDIPTWTKSATRDIAKQSSGWCILSWQFCFTFTISSGVFSITPSIGITLAVAI